MGEGGVINVEIRDMLPLLKRSFSECIVKNFAIRDTVPNVAVHL